MTASLLDRYTPDELSEFNRIATPEERQILGRALLAELYDWNQIARPKQLPPDGDWKYWALITGRGFGKTRTGAEWLRTQVLALAGDYAILAPTIAKARDVCVESGDRKDWRRRSGFLSVCDPAEIKQWNRSLSEIHMANGSRIKLLSAEEPGDSEGWSFRAAWCDEFASWRYPDAWFRTLLPAVRLEPRRIVITTTPKRNELTRWLLAEAALDPERFRVVRGSTLENMDNLAPGLYDELRRTLSARLARQELEGELLDDVEGALWNMRLIDARRRRPIYDLAGYLDDPEISRLVIAVDPAVTATETSDDTGVVIVGRNGQDAYVIADQTVHLPPTEAMQHVVDLYHDQAADAVVIEANNGGDYLPALLHSIDSTVKVETVRATRGKQTRAEPVHGLMENGRVWFLNGDGESFTELEDQLTSWVPGEPSPDRLDAFVWGVTALFPELAANERAGIRYRGML